MADIRKEQEREELHRAIWAIADELRGSVDGCVYRADPPGGSDRENGGHPSAAG